MIYDLFAFHVSGPSPLLLTQQSWSVSIDGASEVAYGFFSDAPESLPVASTCALCGRRSTSKTAVVTKAVEPKVSTQAQMESTTIRVAVNKSGSAH